VKIGIPFIIADPNCEASKCVIQIARKIFNLENEEGIEEVPTGRGIKAFCMRLLRQLQLR